MRYLYLTILLFTSYNLISQENTNIDDNLSSDNLDSSDSEDDIPF